MQDDTTRARLVDRLIAAKATSGLNHKDFAATIGLSQDHWCHIRRRRSVGLQTLTRILQRRPDLVLSVMTEVARPPVAAAS